MCNPSKTEIIQFSFRFVKNPILSDFLIHSARVQPSDWVWILLSTVIESSIWVIILMKHGKRLMLAIRFIGSILARITLRWWSMLYLRRAWIIVTGNTVAYPSKKQTTCSEFCRTLGLRSKIWPDNSCHERLAPAFYWWPH